MKACYENGEHGCGGKDYLAHVAQIHNEGLRNGLDSEPFIVLYTLQTRNIIL